MNLRDTIVESCCNCDDSLKRRLRCSGCGSEFELVTIDFSYDGIPASERMVIDDESPSDVAPSKNLINWGPDYMIGIKEIDEQHHNIADLINEVGHAIHSGKRDHSLVLEILKKLDRYVVDHFAYEEKLFKATKYPGLNQQVREHRMFSIQVRELHKEFEKSFFDLRSVLRFMMGWFLEHTQGCDKDFVTFWKSKVEKQK